MPDTITPADPLVAAGIRIEPEAIEAEAAAFGISVAKLLANRNNSRASSGPKTPEGKKRSSLNSTRHSLTGQLVCKTVEELEAQQQFLSQLFTELQPAGPSETALTIAIAENTIRLARVRQLEDGIFAAGFRDRVDAIDAGHPEVDAAFAHSETFLEHSKAIALLGAYEQRIRKGLRDDRAELKTMQAERKLAYNQAREDAVKLAYYVQENQEKDPDYDPADHFQPAADFGGFVFDWQQVGAWSQDKLRLKAAHKFYWKPKSAPATTPSVDSGPENDRAA